MVNLLSLIAKLITYAFWLMVNAIHSLVPSDVDMMGEGPAELVHRFGREESWSSWTLVAEQGAEVTGK